MELRSNSTNSSNTATGLYIEPQPLRWTLRLIFIIVFLVGSVGNLVVCMAVIRRKRSRTSNNIFTFNLALSDLLTVLIYVPTQMAAFENDHNWPFGNFVCQLAYVIIPVCLSASIATLLAITTDRYRAIAYPMRPRLSGKHVRAILVAIWTVSIITALPLMFVAREVRPAPRQVYCDEVWPEGPYSRVYWIAIFVIQYILPLGMICALAMLIALKVRRNSLKMIEKSSHVLAAAVRQRMKQTSKITNMLIALVILYAICMLPQHVVYLCMVYGDLLQFKYRVYVLRFANVFPMANSALNPIAYGTLNKEFKMVFKKFFKCQCHRIPIDDESQIDGRFSRSRRFRLAVYRHIDGEGNSVLEYGRKWRRKSSASSVRGNGSARHHNGGTFRARKSSTIAGLKGNFLSDNGGYMLPNGHTTEKRSGESARSVDHSGSHSGISEVSFVQKQVPADDNEKKKPLRKSKIEDCVAKVNSHISTSKSGETSGECLKKVTMGHKTNLDVSKLENMAEGEETERDGCSFVSLSSSLEWDPMLIGCLQKEPAQQGLHHSKIDNLPYHWTTNNLQSLLLPSTNTYDPVDNFHTILLSVDNNNSCAISSYDNTFNPGTEPCPAFSSATSSSREETSNSKHSDALEVDSGFGADPCWFTNNTLSEKCLKDTPTEGFKGISAEVPDTPATPSQPMATHGRIETMFFKCMSSARETTV